MREAPSPGSSLPAAARGAPPAIRSRAGVLRWAAHGDALPLPVGFDPKSYAKVRGCPRYLAQRWTKAAEREQRVAEATRAINALAGHDAAEPGSAKPRLQQLTESQRSALQHIGRPVAHFGSRPAATSSREALFELLRTTDFYSEEAHLREPLDESRFKVLRGPLTPKPLLDRLDGEAA